MLAHYSFHKPGKMSTSKRAVDPSSFPLGQEIVWKPNLKWIAESNLQQFMDERGIESLDVLHRLSIADPGWFWGEVFADLQIEFSEPYSRVLDTGQEYPPEKSVGGIQRSNPSIQFPAWCVGGRMNIVHNCLDKWLNTDVADSTAFIWESEDGESVSFTYTELNKRVCQCANALKHLGIEKGDSVGLFMPMTPELVVAFLAIAKIGGIILPLFSGYGPSAITTRLNDGGAKAVFTANGILRRGKPVHMKPVLDQAIEDCPGVEHVIVSRILTTGNTPMTPGRDVYWSDLIPDQSDAADTIVTDAEDVVMIIYTSGTTGLPKGAVHTHCGFPVKAAQDMKHAMDLKKGEMMFWMTDMGWMMGPWLVFGTLLCGSGMLFYDGAPDYPDAGRLWRIVERYGVTHLGLSPVLIRALKPHGTEALRSADLTKLRAVCSTGSPWDPESWLWVFKHVLESKKPILNYSGGTEISGGIICGNFFSPMKPCSFSGPVPGMDADVVDEKGMSIRGAVGELVIRTPWIGMTRGFWKDRDRYIQTYWSRFKNVWVHGDFAAIDSDGLWYILGRSDDTIKIAGKRLGPAEVESIVNKHESIIESAAIGIPHEIKGEELVIFCVPVSADMADENLRSDLVRHVVRELGKPLKPGALFFTTALPKTRNAKVMRRLIRAAHLEESLGDISSLEDLGTLDAIRNAR